MLNVYSRYQGVPWYLILRSLIHRHAGMLWLGVRQGSRQQTALSIRSNKGNKETRTKMFVAWASIDTNLSDCRRWKNIYKCFEVYSTRERHDLRPPHDSDYHVGCGLPRDTAVYWQVSMWSASVKPRGRIVCSDFSFFFVSFLRLKISIANFFSAGAMCPTCVDTTCRTSTACTNKRRKMSPHGLFAP